MLLFTIIFIFASVLICKASLKVLNIFYTDKILKTKLQEQEIYVFSNNRLFKI